MQRSRLPGRRGILKWFARTSDLVGVIALVTLFYQPLSGFAQSDTFTPIDADHDGLPDVWQARYNAHNIDPAADPDHDGYTNLQSKHWRVLNPFDPASHPNLSIMVDENGQPVLEWPTEVGKRYQIQTSDDLASWVAWGNPFVGTGQPFSVTGPNPMGLRKYYHLVLAESADTDGEPGVERLESWVRHRP